MDDRQAQFIILLGDACASAELGELLIEIQTIHGDTIRGVPRAVWPPDNARGPSLTDYGYTIHIDTVELDLDEVVKMTIAAPPVRDVTPIDLVRHDRPAPESAREAET